MKLSAREKRTVVICAVAAVLIIVWFVAGLIVESKGRDGSGI